MAVNLALSVDSTGGPRYRVHATGGPSYRVDSTGGNRYRVVRGHEITSALEVAAPVVIPYDPLTPAIAAWAVSAAATRVLYGGRWNNADGPSTGGRTYLIDYNPYRIRQDGFIRRARFYIQANASAGAWKLKVFRKNGATFDYIDESNEFTPTDIDGVVQTFNFSTPVACQVGDYIGVYVPAGGAIYQTNNAGATNRYVASDVTASNAFASTGTAAYLGIDVFGTSPFLVCDGDSIQVGHTLYENMFSQNQALAFTGDQNAEPANVIQSLVPTLDYQNVAVPGATWASGPVGFTLSIVLALAPKAIWYHCGVNDVANDRTWAAISADLDTLRAAIPSSIRVFMTEILPWTGASDQHAADIRTRNGQYATWCAANNVTLILCHDALGQTRVSTGQIDDLVPAYCEDGDIHLSLAGVAVFVGLVKAAMETGTYP